MFKLHDQTSRERCREGTNLDIAYALQNCAISNNLESLLTPSVRVSALRASILRKSEG
jgi:hypothetical protein